MRLLTGLLVAMTATSVMGVESVLDTASTVTRGRLQRQSVGQRFALSGRVVFQNRADIVLEDATGLVFLNRDGKFATHEGDFVSVHGVITTNAFGQVYPLLQGLKVMHAGERPEPVQATAEQYAEGLCDMRYVWMEGFVKDAFRDNVDLNWTDVIIQCGRETVRVCYCSQGEVDPSVKALVGGVVRVRGIVHFLADGVQRVGRRVLIVSGRDAFDIIKRPEADAFSVPDLSQLTGVTVENANVFNRHRTSGRVIAVWQSTHLMLRSAKGTLTDVTIAGLPAPTYGNDIDVSGFPVANTHNLGLENAVWRPSTCQFPAEGPPEDITPVILKINENGQPGINSRYHGRAVRLTGTVIDISSQGKRASVAWESERIFINADNVPSSFDGLTVGCGIMVSGICRMDAGKHSPFDPLSRTQAIDVVVRKPADIVILSRPSWWTPRRLLCVVGTLLAAIVGILLWNVTLNRRARAKGQELADEQLAHVTAELKVNERTRLAVELHDALSQTLTGVSMQIDTAAGLAQGMAVGITRCLNLASRTIDACRMELRNTLWDLRSAALDEPDMNTAIRKTLCQNLSGVDLSVRFNVPRETFSDNTAHAVLKIVRELAANALRHGKASSIWIAGTVDGNMILFSVKDNGCGFEPDLAPGIEEGHFGLQGIAERLERLNGEMTIDSGLGKGTKVSVSLPVLHIEQQHGQD